MNTGSCKRLILTAWWARVDLIVICTEHCQFNDFEAPRLEVKSYKIFPKYMSAAVSGLAHKTGH